VEAVELGVWSRCRTDASSDVVCIVWCGVEESRVGEIPNKYSRLQTSRIVLAMPHYCKSFHSRSDCSLGFQTSLLLS
jgi:hypothetical protein